MITIMINTEEISVCQKILSLYFLCNIMIKIASLIFIKAVMLLRIESIFNCFDIKLILGIDGSVFCDVMSDTNRIHQSSYCMS